MAGRMAASATRPYLAGLAWVLFVLIFYYRRAWRLLAAGLSSADIAAAWSDALPTLLVAGPLVAISLALAAAVLARSRSVTADGTHSRSVGSHHARRLAVLAGICAGIVLGGLAFLAALPHHGAAVLPWLGEATRRAAMAGAGAGLVLASAWGLGGVACRLVGGRPPVTYRLAVGLGGVSYLSLGLALAGLYRPAIVVPVLCVLAVCGVAIAVLSLAGAMRRLTGEPPVRQVRTGDAPPGAARLSHADLLWAGVALVALGLAFVGALAPEIEYDALWYHLWLPRLWLEHGHPVDVLSEYVSLYPLTWELLFGDALASGGPVAAKLLHFACLPLTALAAWHLARRFFEPASAWLSAALVVTVPVVFWEATTAYIDLALALYVTLGVYALLRYLEDVEDASPHGAARAAGALPHDRAWLLYAALAFGLAVAIKHLGLIVVGLACAGLAARAIAGGLATRRESVAGRGGTALEASHERRRLLSAALLLGIVALMLALPWYWRAWSASGNPFFPEFFKIFGARPPERWDVITERGLDVFKARFGFPRTPLNLALLPWNVTQHGAAFGGCLGALFLAVLPWLAAGVRQRQATRWLLYLVAGYVAVWASPISSFQLRFLVPVLPLLCVLAATAITRIFASLRGIGMHRPAYALLAVLLLLNLPPFIPLQEGDRARWTGWLTHVTRILPLPVVVGRQSSDEYLRREVATYGAWTYLGAAAPSGAVVLDVGGGDNFYATRDRIPVDATLARGVWAEGSGAGQVVLATLARLGVTHLVMDKSWLERMEREGAALGSDQFRREALELQHEDQRALVYRALSPRSSTTQRSLRPN